MFSQEYLAAIAILIVQVLKMFGIEIGNDAITGILTGVLAIWVAIRRYQKRDINIAGARLN